MNSSPQMLFLMFMFVVVIAACIFTAGIVYAFRNQVMQARETYFEMLLWGGGFVVYAVVDYLLFMR